MIRNANSSFSGLKYYMILNIPDLITDQLFYFSSHYFCNPKWTLFPAYYSYPFSPVSAEKASWFQVLKLFRERYVPQHLLSPNHKIISLGYLQN